MLGRVKILLASTLVLAALGLAGCGEDSPEPTAPTSSSFLDDQQPNAVVTGRLLKVDADGKNPEAAAGTVILTGKNGAQVSDEVDRAGIFTVSVLPGEYEVSGKSPQPDGGSALCQAANPTTKAEADSTTTVDVLCYVR